MNFEEMLSTYVGRSIEAVTGQDFYSGELVAVNEGRFTVRISNGYSPRQATMLIASVSYVRIIM
jgi:hypothetical protein